MHHEPTPDLSLEGIERLIGELEAYPVAATPKAVALIRALSPWPIPSGALDLWRDVDRSCGPSRLAAVVASRLMAGEHYPLLGEQPERIGRAIAEAVADLWEARAELANPRDDLGPRPVRMIEAESAGSPPELREEPSREDRARLEEWRRNPSAAAVWTAPDGESFGDAFAKARAIFDGRPEGAGGGLFAWRGGLYTTETAEELAARGGAA